MNTMIIRGEKYYTPLPLWHNGDGTTPKKCSSPSQFPDLGGVKSL